MLNIGFLPYRRVRLTFGVSPSASETFYQTQTLFQFSASPSHFLGTSKNATFAHFMKKSLRVKTGFLSDYQVLFLLLNGLQIEKSFSLSDRFMTSEGSDTLILPFTSKTGQSIAQNRRKIFNWGFINKERTYFGIL